MSTSLPALAPPATDSGTSSTRSPVTMTPRWTGQDVEYALTIDGVARVLDAAQARLLRVAIAAALDTEDDFVEQHRREQNSPARHGLVHLAPPSSPSPEAAPQALAASEGTHRYVAPALADASGAPLVTWCKRLAGGDPGWRLELPEFNDVKGPPLDVAAWDDRAAVEHLCEWARQPNLAHTMYALAHPDVIERRRAAEAARREREREAAAAATRLQDLRAWWATVVDRVMVPADTLRSLCRTHHIGDGTVPGPALQFTAVPLDPERLLANAACRALITPPPEAAGVATRDLTRRGHRNEHLSAQFPVLAWRVTFDGHEPAGRRINGERYDSEQDVLARLDAALRTANLGEVLRHPSAKYGGWAYYVVKDVTLTASLLDALTPSIPAGRTISATRRAH